MWLKELEMRDKNLGEKNLDPTTQEKVLTLHSKLDANRRFVCYIKYSKIPFVLLCLIDCNICRNKQSMMKVTLNFLFGRKDQETGSVS